MKMVVAISLVSLSLLGVSAAEHVDITKLDQRIDAAHTVLHELMATPDKGIPLDLSLIHISMNSLIAWS